MFEKNIHQLTVCFRTLWRKLCSKYLHLFYGVRFTINYGVIEQASHTEQVTCGHCVTRCASNERHSHERMPEVFTSLVSSRVGNVMVKIGTRLHPYTGSAAVPVHQRSGCLNGRHVPEWCSNPHLTVNWVADHVTPFQPMSIQHFCWWDNDKIKYMTVCNPSKKNTRQQWQHTYMHTSLFAQEVQHDIQRDMTQCEPDSKALDKKHPQLPVKEKQNKTQNLYTWQQKLPIFTFRMAFPASSQRKKLDEMTTTFRQLYCLKTSARNVPILLKGPSVRPNVVYTVLSSNSGSVATQETIGLFQKDASSAAGRHAAATCMYTGTYKKSIGKFVSK